jgi:hypothetical protein
MGSLLPKPEALDPPPVPEPLPIPDIDAEAVQKTQKKKKGQAATILTGDLVPPPTGQATLLGGR